MFTRVVSSLAILCAIAGAALAEAESKKPESLGEIVSRISAESVEAYKNNPYSALSKDYFSRFARDSEASVEEGEIEISGDWKIVHDPKAGPLGKRMAGYLADFLTRRMNVEIEVVAQSEDLENRIELAVEEDADAPAESFNIAILADRIAIEGADANGVRDGVVKLVDLIGLRGAPILKIGTESYEPRLRVRLGTVPWLGSHKDLVFMGFNALFGGGGNLHSLSSSDLIPELKERQNPAALQGSVNAASEANKHGLKTFAFFDTRKKFAKDHPVFAAHPDMRGALTWKADGEYVLCTEHPVVRQYLRETMREVFAKTPGLEGAVIIIGGEGFYHCFMRPFGVEKGHTNCERCEAIGAATVVANLCNNLAEAAREANPDAVILAWPYSAEHVWSVDHNQIDFIEKLGPGTGILTEIEKSEFVQKPGGVNKHLWDYSVDMIGPGDRAAKQIAACRERGIPIYLKSEPELSFEAPRLPNVPCMDRWVDRAEALSSCGATGAFVFPAFRPCYGSCAAEVGKLSWWNPAVDKERGLLALAGRIAGKEAAPHLRAAWKLSSDAVEDSPELPPYYTGPYYLGPMHPMIADPEAELPEVFNGYYFFYAEIADDEGVKKRPTYFMNARGDVPVWGGYYRAMEEHLAAAAAEIEKARPLVPERLRIPFEAEASTIVWFYRTARTHANFYESCLIRDEINPALEKTDLSQEDKKELLAKLDRWMEVLSNERENTREAYPLMEADTRLDPYYGSDHSFSHGAEMMEAKLKILEKEIEEYLPGIRKKLEAL